MQHLYSSKEFEEAFTYAGNDLGAVWSETATRFRVWAPTATEVKLNLYPSCRVIPMTKAEKGTWVCTVCTDLPQRQAAGLRSGCETGKSGGQQGPG